MKNTLLFFLFLLCIKGYSQNFFIGLSGGYNQKINTFSQLDYFYDVSTEVKEKFNFGLGQGVSIGVNIGYFFNKNIGLELPFIYFKGAECYAVRRDYKDLFQDVTHNFKGQMFKMVPSIILKADIDKKNKFGLFIKFGGIIGITNIIYKQEATSITGFQKEETWNYNGGLSLGFSSSLGLSFIVFKNISIIAEARVNSISYSPLFGKLTAVTINGSNALSSYSTSNSVEFVDKSESNSVATSISTNEKVKTNYPFSSIGLNIGIQYTFGKKKSEETKE